MHMIDMATEMVLLAAAECTASSSGMPRSMAARGRLVPKSCSLWSLHAVHNAIGCCITTLTMELRQVHMACHFLRATLQSL